MRSSLLIITSILLLTSVAFGSLLENGSRNLAFAQDSPLEVSWEDDPLFDYNNLAPGDPIESREIKIKNTSSDTNYGVYFGAVDKSFKEGGGGGRLHDELGITLTDGGAVVYWDGTLAELFQIARDNGCESVVEIGANESCAANLGVILEPEEETTVKMSVDFDESVSNNSQGSEVVFNLLTGFLAAGTVAGAVTGPAGLLGIATGADLLPSLLGSLAALSTGLYLRRRSSSENQPRTS